MFLDKRGLYGPACALLSGCTRSCPFRLAGPGLCLPLPSSTPAPRFQSGSICLDHGRGFGTDRALRECLQHAAGEGLPFTGATGCRVCLRRDDQRVSCPEDGGTLPITKKQWPLQSPPNTLCSFPGISECPDIYYLAQNHVCASRDISSTWQISQQNVEDSLPDHVFPRSPRWAPHGVLHVTLMAPKPCPGS